MTQEPQNPMIRNTNTENVSTFPSQFVTIVICFHMQVLPLLENILSLMKHLGFCVLQYSQNENNKYHYQGLLMCH